MEKNPGYGFIFHWGGSHLDFSLLHQSAHQLYIMQSTSSYELGGDQLDQLIFQLLLEKFIAQTHKDITDTTIFDNYHLQMRLRSTITNIKMRFHSDESTLVEIFDLDNINIISIPFSKMDFEDCIHTITGLIELKIHKFLQDAAISKEEIHHTILVGGCSNLSPVIDLLKKNLPNATIYNQIPPEEVIAYGLALKSASTQ